MANRAEAKEYLGFMDQMVIFLPAKTNIISPVSGIKKEKDLLKLLLLVRTDLDASKNAVVTTDPDTGIVTTKLPPCQNSTLEQFFVDFQTYGLREAIAYLAEANDFIITELIEKFLIEGYRCIAEDFLANIDNLKAEYKQLILHIISQPDSPEELKELMPKGFLSDEAKLKYASNPRQVMTFLKDFSDDVISRIDIEDNESALFLFMLSDVLISGHYWGIGEEQHNLAI